MLMVCLKTDLILMNGNRVIHEVLHDRLFEQVTLLPLKSHKLQSPESLFVIGLDVCAQVVVEGVCH